MSATTPPTLPPQPTPTVTKRAPRPKRQLDGILVTRSAKAPGAAQYCMHELEFSKEIHPNEQNVYQLTQLFADWEPYFDRFEAKYVRSQIPPQKPAPTPPPSETVSLELDKITWYANKFGPGDYVSVGYASTSMLRNRLEAATKPITIGDFTYSLNAAKTYIYRKKTQ